MFLAALVVGLLTAYYLGVKAGAYAAGASAALFFVAAVMPPLTLVAYGLVAVGLVALFVVGPKKGPSPATKLAVDQVRKMARRIWRSL